MTDLEKHVQRDVTAFFTGLGCTVVRMGGAPRRTTNAAGVPDLWVFCPRKRLGFWFEVKAVWGRKSDQQAEFAALCGVCRVPYCCGGMPEAREFAKAHRIMWAA